MMIVVAFLSVLPAVGCTRERPDDDGRVRLGFVNNPLAAALYVAEARAEAGGPPAPFRSISFGSSGDIGLALLAGELDSGLIETAKARSFLRNPGFHAIGGVDFPYGATLVLRKDLNLRLDDLAGYSVAVQSAGCRLFHQFQSDAQRLGVDTQAPRFVYLSFEDMASALEAKKVDAILTQGAYALLSVALGHKILYQNWDVSGKDLCCPATAAQIEWVLVVRSGMDPDSLSALVASLRDASTAKSSEARHVISRRTRIPRENLETFPVAGFSMLSAEQRQALGDHITEPAAGVLTQHEAPCHPEDSGDNCSHGKEPHAH